jgi:hypothetical protein
MHYVNIIAHKSNRERRAPFNPSIVKRLIQKDGAKVIVQPSNRRAYPMQVCVTLWKKIFAN